MIDPLIIEAMVSSGCTAQQLAAVMKADAAIEAAKIEASKEKARARFHRWKESHSNADKRLQTLAADSSRLTGGDARGLDKTSNLEIEPQVKKEQKDTRSTRDVSEFRSELSTDLDPERIEALLKHRKAKRGQITAHAARLFRRDAEAAGLSLADATDTCISRNWITVKAEWLQGNARTGPPGPKPGSVHDAATKLMEKLNAASPSPGSANYPPPRLLAGVGSG